MPLPEPISPTAYAAIGVIAHNAVARRSGVSAGALRIVAGIRAIEQGGKLVRAAHLHRVGLADPVNVRRRVAELVAAGLLIRARILPNSRATRVLLLTDKGRTVVAELERETVRRARTLTR